MAKRTRVWFLMLMGFGTALILPQSSSEKAQPRSASTSSCCIGTRGNINGVGIIDASDLSALVSYLVNTGYVLPCPDAADINGSGLTDAADLSNLVAYLSNLPIQFPPCPPDTSEIPIPVRMAALDSVNVHLAALVESPDSLTQDSIAHAILAYLQTRPEFEAAGMADDSSTCVWARFTDGRLLIIPNDRYPDYPADSGAIDTSLAVGSRPNNGPQLTTASPPEEPGQFAASPEAGALAEFPYYADCFLFSGMSHLCFTNPIPTIKWLLEQQHYTCVTGGSAEATEGTIANLKTVNNAGVFYYDSHGGKGQLKSGDEEYSLWTADVVTDWGDSTYKAMLDAGELSYMDASTEVLTDVHKCGVFQHYGITSKFVKKYMHFAQNSLAYIDCCSSNNAAMKVAFTDAGASAYLGWSHDVKAGFSYKTCYYLFDRMLGTNALQDKENPPQRPFDLAALWNELGSRGKLTDPWRGAKLILSTGSGHFGLLAPSIQFASIREDKTQPTLVLSGLFGTDPVIHRGVTLNGAPLDIVNWYPDTILCYLPATGAQASGALQVYVDELAASNNIWGRTTSNKVNITEWNGQIEYTLSGPDSLLADLKMGIHFRADVHNFREKPHQKPFKTLVIFQSGLKDSTGTATWSGEHNIPADPCQEKIVMSGSDDMGNCWQAADHGAFKYDGGVDMMHNQIQFNLTYGAGDTIGHMYYSGPTGCPNYDFSVYLQVQNDSCLFNVLPNDVMQLTMAMDSTDYSIKPDSTSCDRKAIYWLYYFDQAQANAQIKWNKWTAKFKPDARAGE